VNINTALFIAAVWKNVMYIVFTDKKYEKKRNKLKFYKLKSNAFMTKSRSSMFHSLASGQIMKNIG
jgi:hypothetical protein